MSGTGRQCVLTALLCAAVFIVCNKKEQTDFPRAAIIVGNVELVRKGETHALEQNQYLRAGDTLRVKENSKVKLELPDSAAWYLNKGSELVVHEAVALSGVKRRLPVTLRCGQLHIVKHDEAQQEYLVASSPWTVRITAADITICAGGGAASCGIILFSGFATFTLPGGTETVIPACHRLAPSETAPGELHPLRPADITSVKGWVGSSVVNEAIGRSGCSVTEEAAVNDPPRWLRLPRETASLGEAIVDTIEAVDPEQTDITYMLSNAPAGMSLDTITGVINYKAASTGDHPFTVIATDAQAQSCTAGVVLSVTSGLSLRLIAPRTAEPGKPVAISVVPQNSGKKKVRFRFDLNGDGKFDFPPGGSYGMNSSVKRHIFTDEGVFQIKVEARSDDGQAASVKRQIIINAPPVTILKVTPALVAVGSPVEFDVAASTDSRNGAAPLKVRFDVDGNGIWDLPEGNEFLTTKKVTYAWDRPGTYRIVAQTTDKDGASSTASVQVIVSKGVTGGTIQGPDTVHVGDSVQLTCLPQQSEFPVREFAWSFDGDTIYEKVNGKPGIKTLFNKAGVVTVVCRITDEKGQQGKVIKVLKVINSAAKVDAGGPYRIGVNKEIVLAGTGNDPDSRIVGYSWDVNGDGTIDRTSKNEPKVAHTYKNAGIVTAYFYVETGDGKKTSDSARVEVINKPPTAAAGDDIVSHKNRKVKLAGSAADEDGHIALFEWDFNSDGIMDWSSRENGNAEHEFAV